jgi:sugar/nucleoside kinase (ribokinase family)
MVEFFREGMASIIGSGLDLVFCNEAEALNWGETDSLAVAIEKLKRVARSFVITLGARGAITFDGNEQVDVPPHRVQAVDTNGAGDMFAGAFLYALSRGEDFPTAGRFASLAAGRIVASYGPRLSAAQYRALRAEFFGD